VRAVIQRVSEASVSVGGIEVARIGPGLAVLVCVATTDTAADAEALADKIAGLRIFPDDEGKMNLAVTDIGGAALIVSQFTLCADISKGRRPSFVGAAPRDVSVGLLRHLVERIAAHGVPVSEGRFGERMAVALINDGPVTIVVDVSDGRVR
jgi:D-tyrosyl-tRNA(Tyr) deacylase